MTPGQLVKKASRFIFTSPGLAFSRPGAEYQRDRKLDDGMTLTIEFQRHQIISRTIFTGVV